MKANVIVRTLMEIIELDPLLGSLVVVVVAVVAQRGRRVEKAVVITNSILKLVDLGDLGLQFPLEML